MDRRELQQLVCDGAETSSEIRVAQPVESGVQTERYRLQGQMTDTASQFRDLLLPADGAPDDERHREPAAAIFALGDFFDAAQKPGTVTATLLAVYPTGQPAMVGDFVNGLSSHFVVIYNFAPEDPAGAPTEVAREDFGLTPEYHDLFRQVGGPYEHTEPTQISRLAALRALVEGQQADATATLALLSTAPRIQ